MNGKRNELSVGLTAALFALLAACSEAGPTGPDPGPDPGAAPTAIALQSGDDQNGKTVTPLGQPLEVRVTDAEGEGEAGVAVRFSVTEGAGTLSAETVVTNLSGVASVTLTLGPGLGVNRVEASVPGLQGSPVTFTARATVLVIEMRNIAFVAPDGTDRVSIAVGDTIEWVNRDAVPHTVTATAGPGDLFASGVLQQGATFQFVPDRSGSYEYLCEIHPGIMRGAMIAVE